MKQLLTGLALLLALGISSSCVIPTGEKQAAQREETEGSDLAKFPRVSFRVGSMKKTRSGVT